jgi:hypothetical protein
MIGTEPTAAARCNAYWLRLSRTRADAPRSIRSLAMSRLDFEAVKWRAVWPLLSTRF